jgi:ubiquinone/menaquinone biosynthesis C-methylase UbiE
MQNLPSKDFYRNALTKIFTEKKQVVDIGGGLRLNRRNADRILTGQDWLETLVKNVDYKILNPVADHDADIIGDIHHLPFADNSQEAIICSSVLEHVEDPFQAAKELHRTLKPGGYCFVFVPFLFFYHVPSSGKYKDYWRFTDDGVRLLFRDFSKIEIAVGRGAIETWLRLNPATQKFSWLGNKLDQMLGKANTKQTSGYSALLTK